MSRELPMPMPVGSPHVMNPPMFAPRGAAKGRTERRDQREYARRRLACDLWLIDAASRSVLRCKTDDVGDAGLHATAPVGFGLAVGQRYEVRMANPHASSAKSADMAKSLGYATVIRTEIHVGAERHDRVGCAVEFDAPQLIPV